MDNYLIDRETLGRFVDELIKQKPLPASTLEEHEDLREQMMSELDDKIGLSLFGQFTEEQNAEFNKLLDDNASEEDYDNFFAKHQINVKEIVTDTMKNFADDYMKGVKNV